MSPDRYKNKMNTSISSYHLSLGVLKIVEVASIFILQIMGFISRSHLDPNAIHDGIMYATAISFSEGGTPNKDAFNQYGPLNSVIHGYWLNLFGTSLLSLRILSALILALCGVLVFVLIRTKLGYTKSLMISLIWNLGPPLFLPSLLPWSSSISTLAVLIFLLCVKNFNEENAISRTLMLIASCLLSLSIFVRIHMLPVVFLVFIYLICVKLKNNKRADISFSFLGGTLLAALLMLLYFLETSSFSYFIDQGIEWPFFGIATRGSLLSTQQLIIFLANGVIPAVGFIGLYTIKLITKNEWKFNSVFLFLSILAVMIAAIFIANQQITPVSFKNPYFVLKVFSQNIPQVTNFVFLLILVGLLIKTKFLTSISFSQDNSFSELSLICSLGILLQLYPSADQLHIWWVMPVIIVAVVNYSTKHHEGFHLFFESRLATSVLSSICLSLFIYQASDIAQKRVQLESKTLNGMYGKMLEAEFIDDTLVSLESFQNSGQKIHLHCGEGIYAATSAGYLSNNLYFLELDGLKNSGINPTNYHFYCNLNSAEKQALERKAIKTIFAIKSLADRYNLLVEMDER
jgi:hypothetical protein